jgi:hypothetical protein
MIEMREIEMRELIEAELDRVAGGMPHRRRARKRRPRLLGTRTRSTPSKSRTRQTTRARCEIGSGLFRLSDLTQCHIRPGTLDMVVTTFSRFVDPAQLPPVNRSASCSGQEIRRGPICVPHQNGYFTC